MPPSIAAGTPVGIVICADAYRNDVAGLLKDRGARLLVSPASWGPGDCGPVGEWEQRTLDTGLPIMVCNRSGWEADDLDFTEGGEHSGQRRRAGSGNLLRRRFRRTHV